MNVEDLALLVLEFTEVAAPQMSVVMVDDSGDSEQLKDGVLKPVFLSVDDTLSMWLSLPDSSYTYLFVGWMLGKGIPLTDHTPIEVERAVCVALTGSEKNVMMDFYGDSDAPKVIN